MEFPYTEPDFKEKNQEVWMLINNLNLKDMIPLFERFDNKLILQDLMEVFKEKLRYSSTAEAGCLLDLVRKKFSLENYFLEVAIVQKISGL